MRQRKSKQRTQRPVYQNIGRILAVLSAIGLSGTAYYNYQSGLCGGETQTLENQRDNNYFDLLRTDQAINTMLPAAISAGSFSGDKVRLNVWPDAAAYMSNASDLQTKQLSNIQVLQNRLNDNRAACAQYSRRVAYFLYPSLILGILAASRGELYRPLESAE